MAKIGIPSLIGETGFAFLLISSLVFLSKMSFHDRTYYNIQWLSSMIFLFLTCIQLIVSFSLSFPSKRTFSIKEIKTSTLS